jgi:N-acetylglucosamine-6-phosphate deacetylase
MKRLTGTIARPDGSLVRGEISFDGRIDAVEAASVAGGDFILPGLIDLQVNGSHGIDVMTAPPEALVKLGEQLACEGTTAWLPTAVTAPLERIELVHASIAEAVLKSRGDSAWRGAAILGMHLEGPFISPLRLGAHPRLNIEPRGEALERVLAMDQLRLVTLAPELPGALDAIARLATRGVAISIGHTNATLEEANAGIAAGARMFTHLYNAMRPLNHRDPGVIAAALARSAAYAALIPDGVHVHPEMIRLACRARGRAGIIAVTDKVVLAGAASGEVRNVGSGGAAVRDGAVRLGDGTLAGSIITMLDGLRMLVDKAGVSVGDGAVMASSNPAALMGASDRGRIQVGARADLIVLSAALELKAVFVGGREVR